VAQYIKWKAIIICFALSCTALCSAVLSIQAAADWSAPFNLSTSSVDTESAQIVIDSREQVHVVWSEGSEIWHRVYANGNWTPASHVANGISPDLVADQFGRVQMAFVNHFENDDIYFISWEAATGWSLPVNVSESTGTSSSPQLAVAPDGQLALVWSEQSPEEARIYVACSADGWLWSVSPVPYAQGTRPVVAFDATGKLLVAWQDQFDLGLSLDIFFSQCAEGQWTLPEDVSASPLVESLFPSLAVWQNRVYLAWQEGESGSEAVYLSTRADSGWSTPQQRSGSAQAFTPDMAFDLGGNGHLVWTTNDAVQHVLWDPLTDTWQPAESVATGQVWVSDAHVAVLDQPQVIWLAEATTYNRDVYYSVRTQEALPTPSVTSTATATLASTPTATATATSTPTGTSTPTSTPPLTPTEGASWSLFLPIIIVN